MGTIGGTTTVCLKYEGTCKQGFRYISGRHGDGYSGCWAQWGHISRPLPCCTMVRRIGVKSDDVDVVRLSAIGTGFTKTINWVSYSSGAGRTGKPIHGIDKHLGSWAFIQIIAKSAIQRVWISWLHWTFLPRSLAGCLIYNFINSYHGRNLLVCKLSLKLPCWLLWYTWHCLVSNLVVSLSKPHTTYRLVRLITMEFLLCAFYGMFWHWRGFFDLSWLLYRLWDASTYLLRPSFRSWSKGGQSEKEGGR